MKILITGGRSSIALKLLKAFTADEIVLADYGEVPSFSSTAYRLISLGAKNEDTLAHTLLNYCLDENVEAILPLHHFEVEAVAKAAVLFKEFDIEVLLPHYADLTLYLKSTQSSAWAVFNQGELIFATTAHQDLIHQAKIEGISGAYYLSEAAKPVLSLITI